VNWRPRTDLGWTLAHPSLVAIHPAGLPAPCDRGQDKPDPHLRSDMPVSVVDYSHVRLTVRDIDVSRAFYDSVFGFDVAFELPPNADEATQEALGFLFGGVIYSFGGGLLGLRPVADGGDHFHEDRTGLDHISFSVTDLTALEQAVEVLDGLGIAHEGIKDLGDAGIAILEFRDPDNIALELTAPTA
jgi:glyoxylase I family protein